MTNPTADIERIDELDEAKILGYFESVRSNFLVKFSVLWGMENFPDFYELLLVPAREVSAHLREELGFKAIAKGNPEVRENLKEDIVTGAILGAWAVFEQVTRELPNPGYASEVDALKAGFERNIFGFTKAEKTDLSFFQYIRHALMHYNGAYYAHHPLDHVYRGVRFNSAGRFGEKMIISPEVVWTIVLHIERCSIKAWQALRAA